MGRTKRETQGFTFRRASDEARVTGSVPALLLMKSATATAGAIFWKDADGIETAREEEEGDDEEELDEVAADDDGRVFPERADDDTRFDLRGELRRKREDAEGQHEEEGADQREEELLQAVERL